LAEWGGGNIHPIAAAATEVYRGHLSLPLFLFNLSPSKFLTKEKDKEERERG
jgi:hypothetical protein